LIVVYVLVENFLEFFSSFLDFLGYYWINGNQMIEKSLRKLGLK